MNKIETIIERGYGFVSINELISLTYHENVLTVHFEPFPGLKEPMRHLLASRTAPEIMYEIHDLLYQDIIFYFEVMSSDLITL